MCQRTHKYLTTTIKYKNNKKNNVGKLILYDSDVENDGAKHFGELLVIVTFENVSLRLSIHRDFVRPLLYSI